MLSARDFHILFALLDRDRHGYGLVKSIAEQTDGVLELDPANLYRALQRLADEGLVEDGERRAAPDSARIRRYYRITERGRAAVAADAERMARIVEAARDKLLLPPSAGS